MTRGRSPDLDFWAVYDADYDSITQALIEAARAHPEFGAVHAREPMEVVLARAHRYHELLGRAMAGDRSGFEAALRAQGAGFAALGASLAGWHAVLRELQAQLVPRLVAAYGDDPARLAAALIAAHRHVDDTIVIIDEEYLRAKRQALEASQDVAREREHLIELMSDPVTLFDRQGNYLWLNPAAERVLRANRDALIGANLWRRRPDIVGGDFHRLFQRVLETGAHQQEEIFFAPTSQWYEIELYSLPSAIMAITRDVTERKSAAEVGRFFTLTLDLLCITRPDSRLVRFNPAFRILGYSDEELAATPLIDLVHPDDRAAAANALVGLAGGRAVVGFESRMRCKDGSYRDLLWTAVYDPAGLVYAAARDISERKVIEHALVQASRAKSAFLATMSHELRTPLNSIIGFSEVLIDGKAGAITDEQRRLNETVAESGRHLLALINDILDISKIEAGRLDVSRVPCALPLLLAEVVVSLQPLADARGVRLVGAPASRDLPLVIADVFRLRQVLYNLLSNAIKFTPAGGAATLDAGLAADGDHVRIEVTDTGPGIAGADLAKLFTPFTQLDNARGLVGTGLGLALSKRLVELMGGRIGVDSELGRGSLFYVELPCAAAASLATTPA